MQVPDPLVERRDRARGALLGLATGDAVGTTLEFQRPGSFTPIVDMVGGGPFGLEPGQWTDDTSMALCLAESLLDRGGHDPADQLRRYVNWWRDGYLSSTGRCFDIGTTTRHALARFESTGDAHDGVIDEGRAANGSLMRLAPVAIRWSNDPVRVVEQAAASSRPTHPATRPTDACKVLAAMIAALIEGETADVVFDPDFWQHGPLHPEVEAVARGSWRTKEPPEIRGTGFCIDALEAAIWAVAGADDFAAAVLRAANLGDDADTTAAIAGQLAGARFGAMGIPARWRELLHSETRIASLADGLHRHAIGAPTVWSFERRFHVWHADTHLLAGEYPGALGEDDAILKLELLVDAGVRTIVDLTSPNDPLDPYVHLLDNIARARGIELRRIHHPIPDFSVVDDAEYVRIRDDIANELAADRPVFVHCWGGIGRTGTVIGAWLVGKGMSAAAALDAIEAARAETRKAFRSSPETAEQRAVIERLAAG